MVKICQDSNHRKQNNNSVHSFGFEVCRQGHRRKWIEDAIAIETTECYSVSLTPFRQELYGLSKLDKGRVQVELRKTQLPTCSTLAGSAKIQCTRLIQGERCYLSHWVRQAGGLCESFKGDIAPEAERLNVAHIYHELWSLNSQQLVMFTSFFGTIWVFSKIRSVQKWLGYLLKLIVTAWLRHVANPCGPRCGRDSSEPTRQRSPFSADGAFCARDLCSALLSGKWSSQ